jgi:hypothetical protein
MKKEKTEERMPLSNPITLVTRSSLSVFFFTKRMTFFALSFLHAHAE